MSFSTPGTEAKEKEPVTYRHWYLQVESLVLFFALEIFAADTIDRNQVCSFQRLEVEEEVAYR